MGDFGGVCAAWAVAVAGVIRCRSRGRDVERDSSRRWPVRDFGPGWRGSFGSGESGNPDRCRDWRVLDARADGDDICPVGSVGSVSGVGRKPGQGGAERDRGLGICVDGDRTTELG
jgi:hypothetical protein